MPGQINLPGVGRNEVEHVPNKENTTRFNGGMT